MSTAKNLPKWVFLLLLTFLVVAAFTFSEQLFVTMAATEKQQAANVTQSCTLEDGAPQDGKTTTIALGKLGQSKDDKALKKIDVTKFHLNCGKDNKNNNKNKKPKATATVGD